jgi:hypothetical protein
LPQFQISPEMPFRIGRAVAEFTRSQSHGVQELPLPDPPLRLWRKGGR